MSKAERPHVDGTTCLQLTDANFEELVLRSPVPVLVAFCSSRCGPSQRLGATLAGLAGAYGTGARIGRFEMEGRSAITIRYGVQATPTLLFFRGGEPAQRAVGEAPEEWLRHKLDEEIRRKS